MGRRMSKTISNGVGGVFAVAGHCRRWLDDDEWIAVDGVVEFSVGDGVE